MSGKWRWIIMSAGLLWGLGAWPAQAALVVNGGGPALMVDGSDKNSTVTLFDINLTGLPAGYDFGFMEGETFVPIASMSKKRSFFATYTFTGGSLVNFALRYDPTGAIYTMSDPAGGATEEPSSPTRTRAGAAHPR